MRKVIAIVDDDINIRNLLSNFLDDNSFHVIGEKSGKGLINLFQSFKKHIDILVLDVVIPDLNEAKKFLQNMPNQDMHVIIITGYNVKSLIKEFQSVSAGNVFDLLRKPFSKQVFLETIYNRIRQKSIEKE